jgi:hypothetical protein
MIAWLRRMLGAAPQAGEWTVATGDEQGQPVVVRTRSRASQGMTSDRYPVSVELIWRFDGTASRGMPTPELSALMAECEDLLATLESPEDGLLGLSITGAGRREWVWYVADAGAFSTRARRLLTTSGSKFPVEVRSSNPAQ